MTPMRGVNATLPHPPRASLRLRQSEPIRRSLSRLSRATCVVAALALGGCSVEPEAEGPPGLGSAKAALETCVTVRRGDFGTVSDSEVASGTSFRNTAFGSATTATVSFSNSASTGVRHSLFKWDLDFLPAEATVTSAVARLTQTSGGSGAMTVHRSTSAWDEATVTWNSFAEAFDPEVVSTLTNPPPDDVQVFDLTALAQEWKAGIRANHGIIVTRSDRVTTTFLTSENAAETSRPTLDLCYTVPSCDDGIQNQGESAIDCGGPCGACPALGRDAYLQSLSSTAVTLVWTTDIPSDSEVHFGSNPAVLDQVLSLPANVTQHEVLLEGLTPSTRYYYSVGSSHGALASGDDYTFQTAPTPGTRKKFRAWVVGDSGTGQARQGQVRDAMLDYVGAYRPDMFIHLGDMAYNSGTTSEFNVGFFNMYPTILRNTVVWPAIGNHEGGSSSSATQTGPYYTAYVLPTMGQAGGVPSGTEAYYSYDHGNAHFVVLDSYGTSRAVGGAMLTWLAADLAASSAEWTVAFFHHPPYTKGSHNSDTEIEHIQMRENALPILEAGGVDLVLGGHSHIYERSYLVDGAYGTPTTSAGHIKSAGDGKLLGSGPYQKLTGDTPNDGTVFVVAGHGGASVSRIGNHPVMYFSEMVHGSCILDIQENRLSMTNVRYDGIVSDKFAMIKGDGLFVALPDGGESLLAGAPYTVRWSTVGAIPTVNLEYTEDDGATWLPIASGLVNTGSYAWTVPATATSHALVRVVDAVNPDVADESNAGFRISNSATFNAISMGDTWKYHDTGVDLGALWTSPGYDDTAWAEGPAQLGYGDGDEATLLFSQPAAFPSVYFRKHIHLPSTLSAATLEVLHDDGFAVWINGVLVASKYVANGTNYSAFASATSVDNEITLTPLNMAASPFVVGDNVIAVMVKQASASSSDVSFDMELSVTSP